MARSHYRLNAETLLFEVTHISGGVKFKRFVYGFLVSLLLAVGYYMIYIQYFATPHLLSMRRSNADLLVKYDLLNKRFEDANAFLSQIQRRDNNVYRATFGLDIIPSSIRDAGFGGVDRYSYLEESNHASILIPTSQQLDILLKKAYIQSISFDTIAKLAAMTEQMSYCVPAIQPVPANKMRITDGFRFRINPVDGRPQYHNGIDIGMPTGTPIFAAGNGVVETVKYTFVGYGNHVIINHGFGYSTTYAHLHKIMVSEGQSVKRGEQIGLSGNTGKSTAPHLHYEVRYRGKPQNPMNYFSSDIDIDEYEKIIANAQENKEFD
ncbi:MAG: M23 family metallopeptidase [Prevotellaceae bacterium]|jgi:murein DD-endopeptidase MepM/ murein hydrolase activator NlpD|nr:M23 family metallopeptidase [Prevotellaceae bacterium]